MYNILVNKKQNTKTTIKTEVTKMKVFGIEITNKKQALDAYREAKKNWQNNMTDENWRKFCDAKRVCKLLGCLI